MTKQQPTLDGFVPRRAGGHLGGHRQGAQPIAPANTSLTRPGVSGSSSETKVLRPMSESPLRRDIDESLKGINLDEPKGDEKKGRRNQKGKKPKSKLRRIIKWAVIVLIVIGLAVGGYILYRAMNAGTAIFKGSLLDIVQTEPLKEDANGRSNILILGTSEDDPGHQGANLTDSIMVLSVDQKNKNAYMISIPRDLEVQYGETCLTGNSGKINVYYSCIGGGTDNIDATRAALTKEAGFVGEILGMDIQYGVNVNYTVMRELVGALGGITVTIESRDPRGQMDGNFDWKCGAGDWKVSKAERIRRCPPNGHFIDYPNGPVNLDAEHALYLAQARGDTAISYGFEQSNFDREKNQQKIVKAIREKAMSAGVLADFSKVSGIIDALGNNLRTTFNTKEVRTLVNLARDIKDKDIQSISLIDGDNPVMDGNAQPSAGKYQYDAIQALIRKKLSSNPVVREEAKVVVMNGSGVAGVAQTEADKLEEKGFTISGVENAPEGTYAAVEIYQIGEGNSATKKELESIYKTTVKTTASPIAVAEGTSFVVIIGKATTSQQ
jgi:anionic cell wall polymer biosynthesis LytR-Cps2A-Psr (LCP) family protein